MPSLGTHAAQLRQEMVHRRLKARAWAYEHGEDAADIRDRTWPG